MIYYLTVLLDINSGGLNILIPNTEREVKAMAHNGNTGRDSAGSSYEAIFTVFAFALLLATVLLALGGIYYTFINPAF